MAETDITQVIKHFLNTHRSREALKLKQREEIREFNEDYKNLEIEIVNYLVKNKKKGLKIDDKIEIKVVPRPKSLSKTDQTKKVAEILSDKSKMNADANELALLLITTVKSKSDKNIKYCLKIVEETLMQ